MKLAAVLIVSSILFYTSGCSCGGISPTFRVIYYGNNNTGGNVPVDPDTYETDDIVTVLGNTGGLSNTGSFKGWNTAPNGTGINYTQGQTFVIRSGSVNLYAMWHLSVYQLRDTGPAGGIIFYDKGLYSNGWQFLESATSLNEAVFIQWGASGTFIGATAFESGEGKMNTSAIAAVLNTLSETGRASQLCDNLSTGGYTDWFLPSKNELNLLYTNLKAGFPGTGLFANDRYWSSSETDFKNAWSQNFSDGTSNSSDKTSAFRVRPVRAF